MTSCINCRKEIWYGNGEWYHYFDSTCIMAQPAPAAGRLVSEPDLASVAKSVTDDLFTAALTLYTPPFRYHAGYIWDATGNSMVADLPDSIGFEARLMRVRGWGRISYRQDPEQLQDKVGELIAEALTEYWVKKLAEMK